MKGLSSAVVFASALLAVSTAALAAQPVTPVATLVAAAPEAAPAPMPRSVPVEQQAPKADPRFAVYCLHHTGSPIIDMQNKRAERIARANGTKPQLRCTGMGVALRVNPDGELVPDQGQPDSQMR
jgi:hypothetical protein